MSALQSTSQVNNGPFGAARPILARQALDAVYAPRPPATTLPAGRRIDLLDVVAQRLGSEPVSYLEFGVHKGWSFMAMSRRLRNPRSRLVGFDSFVGLPEDWFAHRGRGHFSTGGEMPAIDDPRAHFVRGWFQNTVPEFLRSEPLPGSVLVHFDADLYSSTLFLLCCLWQHVPEYYFVFDEFMPDEIVALHHFSMAFPIGYEFLAATLTAAGRPAQVFGRLWRTEFTLG